MTSLHRVVEKKYPAKQPNTQEIPQALYTDLFYNFYGIRLDFFRKLSEVDAILNYLTVFSS